MNPPIFKTPEDMKKKADEYFKQCETSGVIPTTCGLALHLGFKSRTSLLHYKHTSAAFNDVISSAKLRLESACEQAMLTTKKFTPGQMFSLRANYGWKDDGSDAVAPRKKITIEIVRSGAKQKSEKSEKSVPTKKQKKKVVKSKKG